MLPFGHAAAGLLAAEALLKIARPDLTPAQAQQLLGWGMFFGFAPDLDTFYTFLREKAFVIRHPDKHDHRHYPSHAPVLWLVVGLVIYFFSGSEYYKMLGLLVWLGGWTHFLLDSVEYGIMWLWPFKEKCYALKRVEIKTINKPTFFSYWWKFLKIYSQTISFYFEIIILLVGLYFLIKLF